VRTHAKSLRIQLAQEADNQNQLLLRVRDMEKKETASEDLDGKTLIGDLFDEAHRDPYDWAHIDTTAISAGAIAADAITTTTATLIWDGTTLGYQT